MPEGPALPQKIGRYDVKRLLAAGTMGDTYQATVLDERTRAPIYYVVKVLNPRVAKKQSSLQRFNSEIRDDCILEYRDIGYDAKVQDYFVSDYLEVRPVSRTVLRRERSSEILDLFIRAATALDKAHKRKYAHGNIKSSNFLIRRGKDANGQESVTPILADFGLTYVYSPEHFSGDRLRRTFPYMAPERVESLVAGTGGNAAPGPAADVYSLGVVLAETLSGTLPFAEAETLDDLKKMKLEKRYVILHVNHPVRRVDIRRLNEVLGRCLAADPGGRYAGAEEFASALSSCRLAEIPR